MQGMMFFAGKIDETFREFFAAFQRDPLNRFKGTVR